MFSINIHLILTKTHGASLVAQMIKNLPEMQETQIWSLGWEDPLEKGMAIYSSTLAWRIPWTVEPGRLQSTGSRRVGQDWVTNIWIFPGSSDDNNAGDPGSIPGSGRSPEEGNGDSLQDSCLENPMDRRAWKATVHSVTKSWTWLNDFTFIFFLSFL